MEQLGKYQIIEKIGVGGFGVVYRALDPMIKRHVAIKTCSTEDAETRKRFVREAEICGSLQHRNVVTVFEFGFHGEVPYLVQEYLSGEDLDKKIKRREEISLKERILWLVQISRGLEYAHERGIVHRDIKPANIRILEDSTAKILDFGIAKLAHQESNLTAAGITLGTASYLAPEQIKGGDVDARTDIFSFGILAYEMITYVRPFHEREISTVFYKILNEPTPPITQAMPNCPADLVAIIERCLEKDPARRFQTTTELVRALERLARRPMQDSATDATRTHTLPSSDEPTRARPSGSFPGNADAGDIELSYPQGTPRPQSRAMASMRWEGGKGKRWIGVAAAAAVAAVLLVLGLTFARSEPPEPTVILSRQPANPRPAAAGTPVPETPPQAAPIRSATAQQTAAARPEPAAPAPAKPEPPRFGRLQFAPAWSSSIVAQVGDQRIRLDQDRSVEVTPGSHEVVFSLETAEYKLSGRRRVTVAAGSSERVEVPIERPGKLTVQQHLGTRAGAVRVDGEMVGNAPVRGKWLGAGEHLVEIFPANAPSGDPPVRRNLTIRSNQETVLTFDLDGRKETQETNRPIGG